MPKRRFFLRLLLEDELSCVVRLMRGRLPLQGLFDVFQIEFSTAVILPAHIERQLVRGLLMTIETQISAVDKTY